MEYRRIIRSVSARKTAKSPRALPSTTRENEGSNCAAVSDKNGEGNVCSRFASRMSQKTMDAADTTKSCRGTRGLNAISTMVSVSSSQIQPEMASAGRSTVWMCACAIVFTSTVLALVEMATHRAPWASALFAATAARPLCVAAAPPVADAFANAVATEGGPPPPPKSATVEMQAKERKFHSLDTPCRSDDINMNPVASKAMVLMGEKCGGV